MLYENVQIIEDKKTIGEIDFIIENITTKQLIHMELAYKFYLFDPTISSETVNNWIGPNRNDSLKEKLEKLASKDVKTITYKAFQPDSPGGEWSGEVILSTEGGTLNITQISKENLEKITGQTFGEFKITPIKNRLLSSTTGSTNTVSFPNDPDAWKTAYLKNGDNASDMMKAGFVYRADVVQDSKGYHFVHYIKSGKEGKFYTIEDTNYAPTEFAFKEIFKTTTLTEVKDKFLKHRQSLNK